MTQARKEALTDLLEKVEAGTKASARNDYTTVFDSVNATRAVFAGTGSLDAARALHEEVLPGWLWRQQYNGKIHTHTTHGKIMAGQFSEAEHPDNPARAWLIAILKALITQEPDQ